jgi:hypothetical protein
MNMIREVIRKVARKILGGIKIPRKKVDSKKALERGYKSFLKTGISPPNVYAANVDLFCKTNGVYTEEFSNKINKANPPLFSERNAEGILGKFSQDDYLNITDKLNEKGYYILDKTISPDVCNELRTLALTIPALIPPAYDKKILYDPSNPKAEIYRFDMQDLMQNETIQKLIIDPVLINFARAYLGGEPIFDFPAMWWSTSIKKEASSEAAQLFHFDLDRVKWLKVFIYVNDVSIENGPHSYIEGSHRPGSKPMELLKRGYVRVPDEDLRVYYKPELFKVVCGNAGSIFLGDTKCWHKGMALKSGHRLVFELEYTNSLFVANYPKLEVMNACAEFRNYCQKNTTFASNIYIKN